MAAGLVSAHKPVALFFLLTYVDMGVIALSVWAAVVTHFSPFWLPGRRCAGCTPTLHGIPPITPLMLWTSRGEIYGKAWTVGSRQEHCGHWTPGGAKEHDHIPFPSKGLDFAVP